MHFWTQGPRTHRGARTGTRPLTVVLLFIAAAAAGCGDTATQPQAYGILSGLVLDAAGAPVAGAFVNFGYTVTVGPDTIAVPPASVAAHSLGIQIPLTLPSDVDSLVLVISDHLGRRVRRIAFDPASLLIWDGTDDAGRPVPDGPYEFVLSGYQNGEEIYHRESWTIFLRNAGRETVAKVKTDQRGVFRMPLYELPIWEPYPIVVSYDVGSDTLQAVFGHDVVAYAYRGDGSTVHARLPLTLDDPRESRSVELQLRD